MASATPAPTPAKELSLAKLVDEYAVTRAHMMSFKPNVNPHAERFAELSIEILARHAKQPPAKRLIAEGEIYILPISPQENRSKLKNLAALFKKLGLRKFLEHCTVKLSAARHLPEDERKKFIVTARTGPREIGEPVLRERA